MCDHPYQISSFFQKIESILNCKFDISSNTTNWIVHKPIIEFQKIMNFGVVSSITLTYILNKVSQFFWCKIRVLQTLLLKFLMFLLGLNGYHIHSNNTFLIDVVMPASFVSAPLTICYIKILRVDSNIITRVKFRFILKN